MKLYRNKEWLNIKFIEENITSREIAEICGVTEATIKNALRKFGIRKGHNNQMKYPIQYVNLACSECGKDVRKTVQYYKRRIREGASNFYCSRQCADEAHRRLMTGKGNPNFEGVWNGPCPKRLAETRKEELREHGLRTIETMKNNGTFEERMRKLQKGHERFFSTEEGRKVRYLCGVASVLKQAKGDRTSIEIAMAEELTRRGIEYVEQYNVGNRYVADFFLPVFNIIIECDGDYWHRRPETKARDKRKNAYIRACGYSLYRFWESEINTDVEACVDIVLAEINEKEAHESMVNQKEVNECITQET